jgi:hypothetical protein
MNDPNSYLGLLARPKLSLKKHLQPIAWQIGKLRTMNSVYACDLKNAQADLADYFNRSLHRPFNCLLLGPPGSGKSFIAKELSNFGDETKAGGLLTTPEDEPNRVKKAKVLEFNLSQLHDPSELTKIFEQIATEKDDPKIVLFDEFDVRLAGSSVIRYLIEAMYDGKVLRVQELGKTAFIFSGSYLSNEDILSRVQKESSQLDLPKLIFEYFYKGAIDGDTEANKEVESVFHMCEVYRRYQQEMSPENDVTLYLRQLDKLPDFLSRINGFVIEVPNLASPLEITHPPGALWTNRGSGAGRGQSVYPNGSGVAERAIRWAETEIQKWVETETQNHQSMSTIWNLHHNFNLPSAPILQYKDILLKERLYILLTVFDNERKNRREKKEPKKGMDWTNETVVVMKRNLLNYLCTAPLIHGMRSLNTLMWNLEAKNGRPEDNGKDSEFDPDGREQYTITLGDPKKAGRHVRQGSDYGDVVKLWELIKRENDPPFDGDSYIDIILDDEGGKMRVWDKKRKAEAAQ